MPEDAAEAQHGQPAAPKASSDVFISYASQDKAVASAVCKHLESAGVACWIAPRDVTPGEFYAESIVHAIDSAKVAVLILSQHTADSQHVLREIERATSKRHHVVTFRTDMAPLPAGLEYFLNTSQWLDASATGVHRALPKLADAVRRALAQSPAVARADPGRSMTTRMSPQRRGILIALAAFIVVALGYVVVDKFGLSKPRRRAAGFSGGGACFASKSSRGARDLGQVGRSPSIRRHEREEGPGVHGRRDCGGAAEPAGAGPGPEGDRPHVLVRLQGPERRDRRDRARN